MLAMPAEWYPHKRCWMAWPCHQASWQTIGLERARRAYARVAQAIQDFEPVFLLVNPGDEPSAQRLCDPRIQHIRLPINDSWTRDTGPSFVLDNQQTLAGIDWIHNAWGHNYDEYELDQHIAEAILQMADAKRFQAPLVMEGGAIHVDGEGTLLTTKECLWHENRNPSLSHQHIEDYLKHYLGVHTILYLDQGLVDDETDGHVDEVACFIAPGRVLCLVTSDHNDVNYPRLQDNFDRLRKSQDAKGRTLEVIPIEQPAAVYQGTQRLSLSYINFYMPNGGIVMPSFEQAHYDDAARLVLERCFPDRRIVQVDALDIVTGGGGIHCITQQEPLIP